MEPDNQTIAVPKKHFLSTITPLNNILVAILFVTFPLLTLFLGYHEGMRDVNQQMNATSIEIPEEKAEDTTLDINQLPFVEGAATMYASGSTTLIHVLDADSLHCGERPHFPCKGYLYQLSLWLGYDDKYTVRLLGSNVEGSAILYRAENGDVLLSKSEGDGSCRSENFYTFSAANASTTLTYAIETCDGSDTTYDVKRKEFLSKYGL